ncbi:Zinc finger matrin-type protein 2 [Orchesella cincta]|uniref:Zinc finger matrin-type protein 2 n=1 Tax=Orchesella cincta TaxID=48709 RepID=A0A1D2MUU0_ORCCI|nr:Zinc finger matrin-type protein 2 [Orchesella cincta]
MRTAPDHRRKWDIEEYEKLAARRLAEEEGGVPKDDEEKRGKKRELLKQRDYKVDLDSRLGKSIVITKNTPASASGGYYCNVCDCVVKDSINFLDHINGKKHQRNLGMSMRIERSSLDQVKQRFEINKQKLNEQKKKYDLDKRLQELQEEEERMKEYRRENRLKRKRKAETETATEDPEGADADMAAMMGFSGFGSSKK